MGLSVRSLPSLPKFPKQNGGLGAIAQASRDLWVLTKAIALKRVPVIFTALPRRDPLWLPGKPDSFGDRLAVAGLKN